MGHSDPIHPAGLLEGDWSGHRLTGSAHGSSEELSLLPPPWASSAGLLQEAAPEQSGFTLVT